MPNKILNTTCARCVDHITNSQLRIFQNVQIKLKLVILKHIIKGIVELIRNFLDLELLTPFLSFLSRDLKLFHVLSNSFQFLFNISEFAFSQFSSLIGSLQLILLNSQFPGQFIEFLFVVGCHLGGFSQVLVSLLNLNFIVHGFVLKVLDLLQDSISLFGGKSKFGDSLCQVAIGFLGLFLHEHDTTAQSTDLILSIFEVLLSLL